MFMSVPLSFAEIYFNWLQTAGMLLPSVSDAITKGRLQSEDLHRVNHESTCPTPSCPSSLVRPRIAILPWPFHMWKPFQDDRDVYIAVAGSGEDSKAFGRMGAEEQAGNRSSCINENIFEHPQITLNDNMSSD